MLLNSLKIINIFAAIFCFILAIAVIQCNKCRLKNIAKINFSVFLIAFTSSLWTANMTFMLFFYNNPKVADILGRLNWLGGFIVASYTFSSLAFTKKYKEANVIGSIQFLIAFIFLILAFTKYGIKEVVSLYPLQREFGVVNIFFRIWILLSIIYSSVLTLRYYFTVEGTEKLKFQYYTFGILLYAFFGIFFNSITPILKFENLIYLTSLPAIFWVLASFYSIHYYQLLDIEVIFCDAVRYTVFIFIGLALNYILLTIFSDLFSLPPLLSSTFSLIAVGTMYFVAPIREKINNTIRNIVLRRRTTYQRLLEDTSKAVVEILDMDNLLNYIIRQIRTSLGASKICIFLLDEYTKDEFGDPVYKVVASYGVELKTTYFKQKKIIEWLKKHREPLLLDIAFHLFDQSDYKELTESLNLFGAIIIIPILYKKELIGLITLDQKKVDGTIFDIEDIEILKTLAEQIAIAVQNSKMYKELNTAYLQITRALSLALESKDEYLIGHSDNVTKYAVMLAKKIGLPEKDIYILAQAGILHDLGKIGIHDYILNKPGKLNKEEWEEIKQHPIKGAKVLETIPFLNDVAKIILHHHEHYDGTGYPYGLKGDQIPLLSRILTLADSVDAMMSERPYKERGLSVEEMLEEIIRQKGRHFDPYLVDKFVELVKEHPEVFKIYNNGQRNG